jgi:hypothetical protein
LKPWLHKLKLWQSQRDLVLLSILMLYLAVCMFLVSLANASADRRALNLKMETNMPSTSPILPDVLMDATRPWFDRTNIPRDISDTLVNVAIALTILRALTMGQQSVRVMRQVFFLVGTAFACRALCVWITLLPNPLTSCPLTPYDNLLYDALMIFLRARVACCDVFFSGHTYVMLLCIYVYVQYILYDGAAVVDNVSVAQECMVRLCADRACVGAVAAWNAVVGH